MPAELARSLELQRGFVVEGVTPGSEAHRAGIVPGMLILTLAGVYPRDMNHVGLLLEGVRTGDVVVFQVWRVDTRGKRVLIRSFNIPLRVQ